MKTLMAMAMLGLLSACGGGAAPGANAAGDAGTDPMANGAATTVGNTATTGTSDPMEARIAALTEKQRKIAFFRAIYDADYECSEIVKVDVKPRNDGKPVWLATCDDNGEYYITLQSGGIFTVSGVPQAKRRMPKGTVMLPVGTK